MDPNFGIVIDDRNDRLGLLGHWKMLLEKHVNN
jgi:hypothetical protein